MKGEQQLKTKIYLDHEKLVYSLAWKYSKKTEFEFDELVSEFNLYFCYSYKEYTEDLGVSFTQFFCGNCARQVYSLLSDRKKLKNVNEILVETQPERISHDPLDSVILYDNFVNSTNPTIRSITAIISTYTLPKKGFRVWLKKQLHTFGYKSKDIADAFKTINSLQDPRGKI